jgi:hypothetical protein
MAISTCGTLLENLGGANAVENAQKIRLIRLDESIHSNENHLSITPRMHRDESVDNDAICVPPSLLLRHL